MEAQTQTSARSRFDWKWICLTKRRFFTYDGQPSAIITLMLYYFIENDDYFGLFDDRNFFWISERASLCHFFSFIFHLWQSSLSISFQNFWRKKPLVEYVWNEKPFEWQICIRKWKKDSEIFVILVNDLTLKEYNDRGKERFTRKIPMDRFHKLLSNWCKWM